METRTKSGPDTNPRSRTPIRTVTMVAEGYSGGSTVTPDNHGGSKRSGTSTVRFSRPDRKSYTLATLTTRAVNSFTRAAVTMSWNSR